MKFYFIFILSICYMGCSSLEIKIPVADIKSPEVVRKEQHQVNLTAASSKTYTYTSDGSNRPISISNEVSDSSLVIAEYDYGFADHVAVGVGLNSGSGISADVQYQFLDEIHNDTGLLSSVQISINYNSLNKKENLSIGSVSYEWSGALINKVFNPAISLGYRFNKNFITYAGLSYALLSTDARLEQKPSSDGLDPGGNYSKSLSGSSHSMGFGCQIDVNLLHIKPVIQFTQFDLANYDKSSVLGSLTFSFNN